MNGGGSVVGKQMQYEKYILSAAALAMVTHVYALRGFSCPSVYLPIESRYCSGIFVNNAPMFT